MRPVGVWVRAALIAAVLLALALAGVTNLPNARAAAPVTARSAPLAGVPRYYVAPETTCPACQTTRLVVGDTFTGARLAVFASPAGTAFAGAAAAADDDRTFVVDTVAFPFDDRNQHLKWYRLTIRPGSRSPARLTRLPIPAPPANARFETIAVSGSGRELALAYQGQRGQSVTTELRIYSLSSGKLLNHWSADPAIGIGDLAGTINAQSNSGLRWSADGRLLSFGTAAYTGSAQYGETEHIAVRTLSVTARGGHLLPDSRVVWSMKAPVADISWPAVTPGAAYTCAAGLELPSLTANGAAIVCSTAGAAVVPTAPGKTGRYRWRLSWRTYSRSAPTTPRVRHALTVYSSATVLTPSTSSVQWVSATGSEMIVAWTVGSRTTPVTHFGLITRGGFTSLPTVGGFVLGTPPDIAW